MHWCVILNVYFLREDPGWKKSFPHMAMESFLICAIFWSYTPGNFYLSVIFQVISVFWKYWNILSTQVVSLIFFFFFEYVPHIFREIVSKHSSKIIHTFQILFVFFLFVTKKKNPKPKQLINKFLQFLFFHWLLKKWKKKNSINVTNLFRSNWLWLKG